MSISRLLIGDSSIVRYWPAAQLARPRELVGVAMKEASCLETLTSALSEVTDVLDFVLISMLSDFLIDEASASDVSGSCSNIIGDVLRAIEKAAQRSSKVQVIFYDI